MLSTRFSLSPCAVAGLALLSYTLVFSTARINMISSADAQEATADEEVARQQQVIDRFLTVLEKNPRRGTALDRVYGAHVEAGTLDQLIKRYQDRVAADPKDGTSWTILGLIESQRGRDAAAVEAFTKAQAVPMPDALSAFYRGQSLVLVGQPDEAVKAFEQALTRKPAQNDLLEIFQALGRVHQRAQRTQAALDVWTRLEKLFPNDARVQEQIAATLAEESQHAIALPRYEKLIQLVKDDYRKSVYKIEAAELKVKLNRSQEAVADLEKLLATLNPASWLHREVRRKIEEVFLRTDDQDGLAKYYQSTLVKNPEDVDAMARLARLLARQARVPEAQVWLDKALKLAPSRKDLRQTFIDQLVDDQRYAEAIAQYELLAKADPNNPDLLREWGKLVLKDNKVVKEQRMKAAETIWRRLLVSKPKDPLITTQVADLLRHAEMPDAALELYQKAVTLAPDQPQYLEYLGEFYHSLKRNEEALSTWRKIAEGKQRNAANLARLAEVFASFGYLKEAIPEIQAACKLDPKDWGLHLKAADLLTKAEQYPAALDELTLAEKLAQGTEEAELVLAAQLKVYQLENSLESRIARLIEAAKQAAPTAREWYLRARYHEDLRQLPEATDAIQAAVKREPESIPLLVAAARIQEKAGDLKAAVDLNRRLAAADRRGRSDYLKHIAQLETQLGRIDEALTAGRDLMAAAPGNTDNYEFHAGLCFRLGKGDEGLQTLRRAMRINPNEPKMALALAEALAGQYRTDEAIELYWQAYDKSTQLDDRLAQIQKLTELYLQTNHLDKLLERIERIRRDADDKRETTLVLAQAHSSAGDYGMARKELESLLTDNTRDTQLLQQLSRLATTEGDLTTALKYQQQLAKVAPGQENEYALAGLLSQTGATQESAAITLRLAAKEQDPEKFLKSLDALLPTGQHETLLALTESRVRENPKDWELLYREGVALAKTQPEAAARRFQTILELPNSDDAPGIALKNRLARAAKPSYQQQPPNAMMAVRASRTINLMDYLYQVRYAVGLSSTDYYSYGRQTTWTPADFGQARLAAIGWLLRFARDQQKSDELVAKYRSVAEDPKASLKSMWDAIYVAALNASEQTSYNEQPEVKGLIHKLARAADPSAERLYLSSLTSRMVRSRGRGAEAAPNLPPLSKDEITLMLSAFAGVRQHAQGLGSGMMAAQYVPLVLTELKRAGETEQENRIYRTVVDEARDLEQLTAAIAVTVFREDVPATLALYDKWWAAARQEQSKITYIETPYAIAQLMGIAGAARKDQECFKLLDYYLDHHLPHSIRTRKKSNRAHQASGGRSIYYYYGKQEMHMQHSGAAMWDYYDEYALAVLRTAFEVFRRNDVLSDLRKHLERRGEKVAEGDKVYAHMALAQIDSWNEERESAVREMVAASAAVSQDWRLKIEVARLQSELQAFDDALATVETIAAVDQDSMREREIKALSLAARLGDHDRARQAAERLFGLRLDAPTQMNLAAQMRLLGMNDQAEAVMSRVQRQAGSQLSSLSTLMTAQMGQGKSEVAAQIAYQILRRSRTPQMPTSSRMVAVSSSGGDDTGVRNAALQVLKNSGKLKEMITATEEQLKRSTQSGALVATLSEYYEAAGEPRKALELEAKLIESKPDDANLRYRYARKLAAAGNINEACEQYKLVLRAQSGVVRNDFYEISRVFQQAKKTQELVDVLGQIDLKQLGHYSYVSNLVYNMLRDKQQQAGGLALLKRAWEAFPENRSDLLRNLSYERELWNLPEMFEYGKQSLLPVASRLAADPWHGLSSINSYGSGGEASHILLHAIETAKKLNRLTELRDTIAAQVKMYPNWKAGPLMVALIDIQNDQVAAARPILEQLGSSKDVAEFPVEARWIAGQVMESKAELRPLVIKFYEGALDPSLANMNREFTYSPGPRLLKIYNEMGRRDDARKLLASAEKQRIADNYDPAYAAERRLTGLVTLAAEYEKLDFPLDAVRLYRQLMIDPTFNDPQFGRYTGNGAYYVQQVRTNWKALMTRLAATPNSNLAETLLTPGSDPTKPVLDLMVAAQINPEGIPKLDSQLAEQLALDKSSVESSAATSAKLQELARQHPHDFSVPIVTALLASTAKDEQRFAAVVAALKGMVESHPLEVLSEGQRPNGRQRDEALRQMELWVMATECLKRDAFQAEGEVFAARALEAAKRQLSTTYAVAMQFERAQAALKAKDLQRASTYLAEILKVALARPQVKSSAKTGSVPMPQPAKPAPVAVAGKPVPAERRGALVPPLTRTQFRLAMLVADLAADNGLLELASQALRESLVGGLPVADASATLSTSAIGGVAVGRARTIVRGMPGVDGGEDVESTALVTSRVLSFSKRWRVKGHPPAVIYSAISDIIFSKSKPSDISLFEQPIASWKEPQSLGRELVRWAVSERKADELKAAVAARQLTPAGALKGQVLLVQLAIAMNDDAAAVPLLKKLVQAVKEQPRPDVAITAAHAAGLAIMRPKLTAECAPILEEVVKLLSKQDPSLADGAASLLTRYYLPLKKVDEMRALFEAQLAAKQLQYQRFNNPEYALHRQRMDLMEIVGTIESSSQLPLLLDYLGRAADIPGSSQYGTPSSFSTQLWPLWSVAWQLNSKSAEERYGIMKDWVLPKEKRQSLRYVGGFVRGVLPPKAFLTADQVSFGPPPEDKAMTVVSSFSLLVDAAQAAGKLDELQVAADAAVAAKMMHAVGLANLVTIARGDPLVITKLQELIAAANQRTANPDPNPRVNPQYMDARWLDMEVVAAAQASQVGNHWGQGAIKTVVRELRIGSQTGLLPVAGQIAAEGGFKALTPEEKKQVRLPNLKLWHTPTPPEYSPRALPPIWWSAQDGLLTHASGYGIDSLLFRYPVTGTFEFQFESHYDSYINGHIGYGGLMVEPQAWANTVLVSPLTRRETVRRSILPPAAEQWDRYQVRVTPESIRFYWNGHLTYEDPVTISTSPWITLHGVNSRHGTFRNLKFSGTPIIPRQVELIQGDRLEGWDATPVEKLAQRLIPREPPAKLKENERPPKWIPVRLIGSVNQASCRGVTIRLLRIRRRPSCATTDRCWKATRLSTNFSTSRKRRSSIRRSETWRFYWNRPGSACTG